MLLGDEDDGYGFHVVMGWSGIVDIHKVFSLSHLRDGKCM
jgi:hypothetical protein